MPFLNTYPNRKVFITGHTGFKGSWLSFWLRRLGAQVSGYALPPNTSPNLFSTLDIASEVFHSVGDVRDQKALTEAVTSAQPDIVFHLAAKPIAREPNADPRATFETNVMGTVNLLEAIRAARSVRAVVIVTTDRCYENRAWNFPYREIDALGGHDPYGASKACAELVTAAYRQTFFSSAPPAVATARAGNVIGGGDWSLDHLLPDCARAFSAGKTIIVRYPGALRPWQHVLEPLSGYLWLAALLYNKGPEFAGAWNFGPGAKSMVTVEQIVNKAASIWGNGSYRIEPKDSPQETGTLALDISRARTQLHWQPVYTLDEALDNTIAWYRAFHAGKRADMIARTAAQIDDYAARARAAGIGWSADA